tara:strand:+ start:1618 stop:1878 length:261 start_codon:yes stop_codon:yes gene_type:complete
MVAGWSSETEWWFSWLGALIVAPFLFYSLWQYNRRRLRRKSLTHSNGLYVWIELDGTTQCSSTHPDQPGGAWHSESDGDGGDGGGD